MIPRLFGRHSGEGYLGNSERTMWIRTFANDAVVWDRIRTYLGFVCHGPKHSSGHKVK